MIVLYHSGGASDFSLVGLGSSPETFANLRFNVLRILRSREQNTAVKMLESIPFEPLEATNHFGYEFSVLYASIPLIEYERLRIEQDKAARCTAFNQIAEAFGELGFHIRFIAAGLRLESEPATNVTGLTRLEINKLVNRYIGVSGGYLADFSYRTHHEFYVELDLDIDPDNYDGTTRERFIKILTESASAVQARILDGILTRYPVGSSELRTQAQRDEVLGWIARLKGVVLPRASTIAQSDSDRRTVLAGEFASASSSSNGNPLPASQGFRFDFGLSFAGSDRDLARQLRDGLRNEAFQVFFDEDYEHEMIGHDGSLYLRNVYSRECRFCIVLISRDYDQRDWTNLEREAVQARELRGERGILIPVPIEDYQPPWLPETRIRFDLWKRSIPELVALLAKRCRSTMAASDADSLSLLRREFHTHPDGYLALMHVKLDWLEGSSDPTRTKFKRVAEPDVSEDMLLKAGENSSLFPGVNLSPLRIYMKRRRRPAKF
jgi:hypothetical protein